MKAPLSPLAAVLAALLLLPAGLAAQEAPAMSQYRTGLMEGLVAHGGSLRALLSGEVDRSADVVLHARAVDDVAEMLLTVWPEGSGGEGTRARVEIWENWDDFQLQVRTLRTAAAMLRERAEAGDMDGAATALREVSQTCRACHTDYRSRAN